MGDLVDRTEKFLTDLGVPIPRMLAEQILVRLKEFLPKEGEHVTDQRILEVVNDANVFYLDVRKSIIKDYPHAKKDLPPNLVNRIWDEVCFPNSPELKLSFIQLRARIVGAVKSGHRVRF
jgi:hypothetical protein